MGVYKLWLYVIFLPLGLGLKCEVISLIVVIGLVGANAHSMRKSCYITRQYVARLRGVETKDSLKEVRLEGVELSYLASAHRIE